MSSKIKISLAWQMMIGLALGIVVGALVDSSFAQTWLQPLGDLFIRLIRMVVVPLVLATIIAGAAGISDTSKLGRVAVKVLLVYAVTTGIAVACGLLFAGIIQPGMGLDLSTEGLQAKEVVAPPLVKTLLAIVPINPMQAMAEGSMLQIIFFAVIFGFALSGLGERGKPVLHFFEIVGDVMIRVTHMVMLYAPIGVFGLISFTVSRHGLAVLLPLGALPRDRRVRRYDPAAARAHRDRHTDHDLPQGHLRTVARRLHDLLVRRRPSGQPERRPQARLHEGDLLLLDPARQYDQHERYGHLHGRLLDLRG